MHSGKQEVSDSDRTSFINDAMQLLSIYQAPVDRQLQKCIDTLNEINSNGWLLTTDDIVGLMKEKVEVIRLEQMKLKFNHKATMDTVAENTDAITDHHTKLDSYKGDIKKLDDDLKAAHSIIQRLDVQSGDVQNDVKKLQDKMEEIRTNNEGTCKQINQIIEVLETKVKTMETHIVTLGNKHETMETSIATLENKHETMETNIETLNNKQETMETNIETLNKKHETMETSIAQHKELVLRLTMVDQKHSEFDDSRTEEDSSRQGHESEGSTEKKIRTDEDMVSPTARQDAQKIQGSRRRHQGHGYECSTEKKIRTDADVVSATARQDAQTMQGRKDLRDYLIKKYNKNHSDVPVAPPKQDMWTNLSKYYRKQMMMQVSLPDESQTREGEEDKNITVNSYNDIFCRNGKQCRNIYIKGVAGSGKSVFCQHMVNTWCDIQSSVREQTGSSVCATSPNKQNNIDMLHQFEYLFYITLKHATCLYDVVSMIKENLLNNNKTRSDQLADILENESEKCLILIDGLDEWSPPESSKESPFVTFGLPYRDDSYDWTILTTTRAWKLETIRPKRCEMDQLIELSGLTKESVGETITSVVGYLNKRYPKRKHSNTSPDYCSKHLYDNNLEHVIAFPIILTTLVCIWFEDGNVGKTKCDIYAAMIDMFLRYNVHKTNKNTPSASDVETKCNDLPACFQNRKICQSRKQLLFKLGKLAFHTLFCKDRSSSLVFESCTADIHGMSNAEVSSCLDIGLLSQDSIDTRSTQNEKILSFHHKTIQEFLAAVYISMHTDTDNAVLPTVKDICRSVVMVLEMSQVFVFLSGMMPTIVNTISRYISQAVVSVDEDIQRYRSSCTDSIYSRGGIRVRAIQDLMVNCIKESVDTGLTNIEVHVQDIDCEMWSCTIGEWCKFNKSDILSFSINNIFEPTAWKQLKTITDYTHLCRHMSKLRKLEVHGSVVHIKDDDSTVVIVSIIKPSINTLETLSLERIVLKHDQLEQLMLSVTQATGLRRIILNRIMCSDCYTGCTYRLDLSQHTQLKELELQELYLSELQINTTQLERLSIRNISLQHEQLEQLMLSVTQATGLSRITLNQIKCSDCCTGCICRLDLSQHTQLKELELQELYLSELQINSTQLERLSIRNISLQHEQLEQLMLSVTQATGLSRLTLNEIKCSDCCTGCICRLDLSQHTQLEKLELRDVYVSELQINTTRLETLSLERIVLKHEQLELLILSVTQATGLRDITLNEIKCSDCCTGCTCRLDLSQHTQLKLRELYVSEVQINTTQLEVCFINSVRPASSTPDEPGSGKVTLIFHGDGRKLGVLQLINIVLKHEQLEQLMLFLTQATGLHKITLNKIKCSDCCTGCTCRLDLSQHTRLGWLELEDVYVSELQINTTQLKTLSITNISLQHEQFKQLILSVTQATGLKHITLNQTKCSDCGTGCTCQLDLARLTNL